MPQRRERNLLRCALLQLVSPSGLRGDAAAEEGRLSLQRLQQRKASGDEDKLETRCLYPSSVRDK